MPETKALLHFSDLRGQRMIVENFRDPSREIPPLGMSHKNAWRNESQCRQEIFEGPRRTRNSLTVIGEPESLIHEQLHIQIFGLVADVGRQTREQFEFQAFSAGFLHARQEDSLVHAQRRKIGYCRVAIASCLQHIHQSLIFARFGRALHYNAFNCVAKIRVQVDEAVGDKRVGAQREVQQLTYVRFMQKIMRPSITILCGKPVILRIAANIGRSDFM